MRRLYDRVVHPRLSISAVSSWSWSFEDDLEFWAGAGASQVALSYRKLDAAGIERAVEEVRAAGLRVSNVGELGWCDLTDRSTWPEHRQRLRRAIDVARAWGACLVLTTGPAPGLEWDAAAECLEEMLRPVQGPARDAGVPIALEPTGALRLDISFVTTFRDGVDLARALGVAVCMELNSCFAERDLLATAAGAADVLEHVQVSDFVIGSLCTPDRAVPGDGDIPLARILAGISASGYGGAFELELFGPRIEAEGYASAITRSASHLDGILGQLDAPSAP
jgi:sugar phosphate isomerase/epimerase